MANESGNMEQILGTSNLNNETRFIKTDDNGILQTSTMSNGDTPMILVDTTRTPSIGTILLANATYTSPVVDRPEQDIPDGYMRIWILTDQSGNLYLEESHNGTNWTTTSSAVVSAGVSNILAWTKLSRRYYRCRYVNGATPQTSFIMIHYTKGVNIDPVMIADGDVATLGVKADTANIDPTASSSINANIKGLLKYTIGNLVNNQTNKAVTASTNILTANYTAINYQQSTLMVSTSATGTLSLAVDGVLSTLNSGIALDINKWYAFDVLLLTGSTYNLQLSVDATMQIKWVGGA